LVGDPVRLRQVITNLIGNAIKFTDKGEVMLTVTVDKWREDNTVALHFAVSDTGVGIPPDKLSVIFEAFSQADGSVTRKYGGTGLGLTISTRLVELMRGRLSAESTPGKGSTFHFTAIFGLGKDEQCNKPNTAVLESLQVLVVDDNDANRRVLQNMLQYWKMKVTTVESGAQAILLLNDRNQVPFQYILLDTQMPVVDGFSVAQCLKNFPPARSENNCTVIMMLSSTAQRGIVEKHADLPISVYLSKPIVQFELLDALLKPFQKSPSKRYTESPSSVLIPPNQESRKGGKILLAEDNIVNQRLVLRILEKIGYSITVAENGLKAVQAFEREDFDLILMDVQMPEMGGFEATGKIREFEAARGKRTPIIAMTAHAIQGYREKCLEAGMDGYISKPIRIEVVKKTIEEFVEKVRNQAMTAHANSQQR